MRKPTRCPIAIIKRRVTPIKDNRHSTNTHKSERSKRIPPSTCTSPTLRFQMRSSRNENKSHPRQPRNHLILPRRCAPAPQVAQHITTRRRSDTAEVNTRRDMLGLCRSLSPPSLLLPRDPVTRRRLCVRGAITAATHESIQICVWAVCAVVPFRALQFHSSDPRLFAFFPSVSVFKRRREAQRQRQHIRHVSEEQSRAPTQSAGLERTQKEQNGKQLHTENSNNNNTAEANTHAHMHAEIHHSATPFKVLPKQSAGDTVIRHTLPVHRRGNDADTKGTMCTNVGGTNSKHS
ncbi:hypothetical protein TCSYLVIO_002714, partial [Trypanosoma cruzi]